MKDVLIHYGIKRRSGRYPFGSGEDPYQHESDFLRTVSDLKAKGFTEKQIADYFEISTTELREKKTIEKEKQRAADLAEVIRLKDAGWSQSAIGERIGHNESYVRYLLEPVVQDRLQITNSVSDVLKKRVNEANYIDIGEGSQVMLGVSKTKMNAAIRKLKEEGYEVLYLSVPQAGMPGQETSVKVLAKPDTSWSELNKNWDKIETIEGSYYTNDGGRTYLGIKPPTSVDSSRLQVRFAEDGGIDKDGVIELRRGVEDLSLGNANYAQVRIAVDGTHFLKGMAVYSDDLPDGVDIIFNTNKHKGTPILGPKDNSVLKNLKDDKDNPFGSTLRMEEGKIVGQRNYIDSEGKSQLSPINIVREEGDWNNWSNSLSSQFLSKQPLELINQQLNLSYSRKTHDFEKIKGLTNPEVKKALLNEFADECDSAAVHLKAAALPRQASKVILPLTNIKDNEIYAPTFRDGESVVLVRYPHGGTFELPVLTVNKKIKEGRNVIGENAIDAVGISKKVADRLSGADFDGDTVLVIPVSGQKIKSTSPLEGLQNFDPKESYPKYEGMKIMKNTQTEMGKISNLITDMTLQGATESELARAVRHSMVVIDAEKHELNYKQSYIDNGIEDLKIKYQGAKNAGASTLISRASADKRVLKRKELPPDPETGERRYKETGETYLVYKRDKNGNIISSKEVPRLTKTTRMADEKDAFNLSSGTVKEAAYATYANKLKALANEARKESLSTPSLKYSKSARETYASEVASLNASLNTALKNKPLERQAQLLANVIIKSKLNDNPSMSPDELKKVRTQSLSEARTRTGANKKASSISISDKEWEAIQAGAISSTKLKKILENTDKSRIKELATPLEFKTPSTAEIARMKMLSQRGYDLSEIADDIGFSTTTVSNYLNGI